MKAREKQQIETYLKSSKFKTCPKRDRQVLEMALDHFRKNKQNMNPVSLWRQITASLFQWLFHKTSQ